MRLGEILLKRELVTDAAISEALGRQKTNGGRLGANLIALGYLTEEQLSSVIHGAPAAPNGLSATGISGRNLLSLLLKFVSVEGCPQMLQTLMVPPVAQSGSANTRLGPAIFGQCPSGRCSVPVIKVTIASVIGSQPSSLLYFGNASR